MQGQSAWTVRVRAICNDERGKAPSRTEGRIPRDRPSGPFAGDALRVAGSALTPIRACLVPLHGAGVGEGRRGRNRTSGGGAFRAERVIPRKELELCGGRSSF